MCMMSVIGDAYKQKFQGFPGTTFTNYPEVTRAEFEALRKEMLALKELLEAANKFDQSTGQPHCETEDKMSLIRKVAEAVGVDLDDIIKPKPA
jgi:hypothetical protein